jgi:hypothetical protein
MKAYKKKGGNRHPFFTARISYHHTEHGVSFPHQMMCTKPFMLTQLVLVETPVSHLKKLLRIALA